MWRLALPALAACNSVLGVHEFAPIDAPAEVAADASFDAALPCVGLGLVHACAAVAPADLVLTGMIDTDLCDHGALQAVGTTTVCEIFGATISIAAGDTVHAFGAHPLVLLASGDIDLAGTLDGSSTSASAGPAGMRTDCDGPAGGDENGMFGAGGGAGGSYDRKGGAGGSTPGASGGNPLMTGSLGGLLGGCRGGIGGKGITQAAGGVGGGVLYLAANGAIDITGAVVANGAGGAGGADLGGGGGGGTGGTISFDAATLTGNSTAFTVIANGGGGGGGAYMGTAEAGGTSIGGAAAMGGIANNAGGVGGTGGTATAPGNGDLGHQVAASRSGAGGGGGGAAGRITIYGTPSGLMTTPAPTIVSD